MSVPVLLFASYAEAFGTRELIVPVSLPCRIGSLVDHMRGLPGGDRLPTRPLVAINQAWVRDPDAEINLGDEVAVIPPVAGG